MDALRVFPEAEGEELLYLSRLISDMNEDQIQTFALAYRSQRKDPTVFLILTLVGFVIVAGIGRFWIGHIGMGVLYLLTFGLCYIGTIIDLVRYKAIVAEVNGLKANNLAMVIKGR